MEELDMPQDFGAAQPIANFFGYGKKEEKAAPKKVDTSWHDAMVKRANDGFAKSSSGKKIPNTDTKGKTTQKPKARKRTIGKK